MHSQTYSRAKSASRQAPHYNPIIPSEQPVSEPKPGKAQVNQSFVYSKYTSDRPKGKLKTEFSKNSEGTFNINDYENTSYRPSIRVNIQQNTQNYPRAQSIRVDGYSSNRQPLIQERPPSRPRNPRGSPSPILRYENERKCFLPSDVGINTYYPQQNKSSVFNNTDDSYLFNGKFKCLLSKPTEIRSVIGYEYALPYREQKVTPKP